MYCYSYTPLIPKTFYRKDLQIWGKDQYIPVWWAPDIPFKNIKTLNKAQLQKLLKYYNDHISQKDTKDEIRDRSPFNSTVRKLEAKTVTSDRPTSSHSPVSLSLPISNEIPIEDASESESLFDIHNSPPQIIEENSTTNDFPPNLQPDQSPCSFQFFFKYNFSTSY